MIRTGKNVTKGTVPVQSNTGRTKRKVRVQQTAAPLKGKDKRTVKVNVSQPGDFNRGNTNETDVQSVEAGHPEGVTASVNETSDGSKTLQAESERDGFVDDLAQVLETGKRSRRGVNIGRNRRKVADEVQSAEKHAQKEKMKGGKSVKTKTARVKHEKHGSRGKHRVAQSAESVVQPNAAAQAEQEHQASKIPERLVNCILDYSVQTDLSYVKFLMDIIEEEDSEPIVELNSISTYQGIASVVESVNKTLQTATLPSDFVEPVQEDVTVTNNLEVEIL